jgi:3-deoxy-manno-octulosonate cytidylyltransferase (CMP-KDO synthetase)
MDFQRLPMLQLEATEKIEAIRYLEYGKKLKMVETTVSGIEIDTPEDLERAKKAWK